MEYIAVPTENEYISFPIENTQKMGTLVNGVKIVDLVPCSNVFDTVLSNIEKPVKKRIYRVRKAKALKEKLVNIFAEYGFNRGSYNFHAFGTPSNFSSLFEFFLLATSYPSAFSKSSASLLLRFSVFLISALISLIISLISLLASGKAPTILLIILFKSAEPYFAFARKTSAEIFSLMLPTFMRK